MCAFLQQGCFLAFSLPCKTEFHKSCTHYYSNNVYSNVSDIALIFFSLCLFYDLMFDCVYRLLDEIAALESYLRPALEKLFPVMVVEEWFGTHLEPQTEQLKQLLQNAEHQFAVGGRTRHFKPIVEL